METKLKKKEKMAFQKNKLNPILGEEIQTFLEKNSVQTPIKNEFLMVDAKNKISSIEKNMKEICETLGMDLEDDSLIETPKRIAKMMILDLNWGMLPDNFPKIATIENKMNYDEMIVVKDIKVMSNCEHHFQVIDGKAHVAYIPDKIVIGLSKIARIVDYFSRRPQVQERLTNQIFFALKYILKTEDIAVSISAKHFCMISRGVESPESCITQTNKLGGDFKKDLNTRNEFMLSINS